MGNVFTLDAMREDIERTYAPFQIILSPGKTVTLRNVLRLDKARRKVVYGLLDELGDLQKSRDEESGLSVTEKSAEVIHKLIPLIADDAKLGQELVEGIGDDIALTLKVFSEWMESSQAGEAEGSPS